MRVLLTAGQGFIGRQVVLALQQRGVDVVTCGRQKRAGDATHYACDLLDQGTHVALLRHFAPSHVLHLAWCGGQHYAQSPSNAAWLEASVHLLQAFYNLGGSRFVGVGTCFEYSPTSKPCHAANTPTRPDTLYGKAKLALGQTLEVQAQIRERSYLWCRPFYILGPGEAPHRLVPAASLALLRGQRFCPRTSHAVLDYMDVRDVAEALTCCLLSDATGIINIATGKGIMVQELLQTLGTIAQKHEAISTTHQAQNRQAETAKAAAPYVVGDASALQQTFNFTPKYDIERSLRDCYAHICEEEHGRS